MELIFVPFLIVAVIYFLFEDKIKRASYLKQVARSRIEEIDKLTGVQFEDFLYGLFKREGYVVVLTKSTGDYGADLILAKNGVRIVVQAKRYAKNVGVKSVQEVFTAKEFYKSDEAMVVTNSFFTESAIKLAKASGVKLINRNDLIVLINNQNQQ